MDASILVEAFRPKGRPAWHWLAGLQGDGDLYVIDGLTQLEVLSALRRIQRTHPSMDWVNDVPAALLALPTKWAPLTTPMLIRIWEMRHNLTPYDAAYVALTEYVESENRKHGIRRSCVLATMDSNLAHAPTVACRVELYERGS